MPRCLEMRRMSGVLNLGLIVLQQFAHSRQLICEKASSCRSGKSFSTPLPFLCCNFFKNCRFSFCFLAAFFCQSVNCGSMTAKVPKSSYAQGVSFFPNSLNFAAKSDFHL